MFLDYTGDSLFLEREKYRQLTEAECLALDSFSFSIFSLMSIIMWIIKLQELNDWLAASD